MIIYRLFRYFLFLFFVGTAVLFSFRNHFTLFPGLSVFFDRFDAYYQSLDQKEDLAGDPEAVEKILQWEAGRLLNPKREAFNRFLGDEQTISVLEGIVNDGLDPIEELIRTYFVPDENFKDFIIYDQGAQVYRYETGRLVVDFGIRAEVPLPSGALDIYVLYYPTAFLENISLSYYPITVKWKKELVHSPQMTSRSFVQYIKQTQDLEEGFGVLSQRGQEILYYLKPGAPYVESPVFFFIENLPKSRRDNRKIFFTLIIFIFLVLLLALDRAILHYFTNHTRKIMRKNRFPAFQPAPENENSDWLDRIAGEDVLDSQQKPKKESSGHKIQENLSEDIPLGESHEFPLSSPPKNPKEEKNE